MVDTEVGYDGGKQVKGRKRHLLVDTLGLVVMVVVTAANVNDRDGARRLFEKLYQIRQGFPRLVRIWVDGGFFGEEFMRWVMDTSSLDSRSCVAPACPPKALRYCLSDGWLSVLSVGSTGVGA
jgi:hypothetical protein